MPEPNAPIGWRLGTLFGIDIVLDVTMVFIFLLVTGSLGMSVLPAWHPEWSGLMVWLTALSASVLLFASIVGHELSHALVGRKFGAHTERIRMFLFGGMAEMDREANSPRGEFWTALAGPLFSLCLGSACLYIGSVNIEPELIGSKDLGAFYASLSAPTTLLFWLGNVNVVLALFNLVPAFPLDGGRLLRALLWWLSGDRLWATGVAAAGGRFFGWLLIVLGIGMALGFTVPVFGSGALGGLWLIFIGWFLHQAARMSYTQQAVGRFLEDVRVGDVMARKWTAVAPEMSIAELIERFVFASGDRVFPVVRHDELIGLISVSDLTGIGRDQWQDVTVFELMTHRDGLIAAHPHTAGEEALGRLARGDVNQLPVIDREGTLVGMVSRESIIRWLALRGGKAIPGAGRDNGV